VLEQNLLHLTALIMVLFFILPGFLYYTRKSGPYDAIRNIALWSLLGLITALLYPLYADI